ncbi:MAG: HEAT repeat domain-containing protein [Anaerolineae bacterium]
MPDTDCQTLLQQLLAESEDTACEIAAIALGQGGDACLPAVAELLASADADHRFWGVRALWANGSAGARARLIACLKDGCEMVRSGAALSLGELKAPEAVEALGDLLCRDTTQASNHAADALAKIGPPAAPVLIAALGEGRAWVRIRAAKALVPVESKAAIAPLIQALDDESYLVRHYAEEALARLGVGQMVYFK